jgi:hypothetical protein
MAFEVEDLDQAVADLRARGVEFATFDMAGFEVTDQIVVASDNYPSKGTGERGTFFFDSEGNLLGLAQAPDREKPGVRLRSGPWRTRTSNRTGQQPTDDSRRARGSV